MVRRESGFVAIFIVDFYLPVAAISVYRRENRGITKAIDAPIHMWYEIRVRDGDCIHLAVVQAKLECSIFLWRKHDGYRPLCLSQAITSMAKSCLLHVSPISGLVGRLIIVPIEVGIPLLILI